MIPTLALLLLATVDPPAAPPAPGTLCITASEHCQDTSGDTATVAAAAVERTYVWRRSDATEIALGTITPGTATLTWPKRAVQIRVRDHAQSEAVKELAVVVARGSHQWQFALRAREAAALARLFLTSDEKHTLTAIAPNRKEARVHITPERRTYEVNLMPRPAISGRVVDKRTRKGIVGAVLIAVPTEAAVAITDFAGQFVFEPADEWPTALRIHAPGYGRKVVPAPAAMTTAALPWTELSPAGTLLLSVRHDADVEAELATVAEDERTSIATKIIKPEEGSVRFEDLDEGEYELRLSGAGPFERYVKTVAVKAEETTSETVELGPVPLDIHVTRETRGVPGARLEIKHMDPRWGTEATTGEDGHVQGALWQQGAFVAFVTTPGSAGAHIARKSLSGVREIEWRIAIEGGNVTGAVFDAREKFPIARANVSLKTKKANGAQELTAVTDEKGEFRFRYVPEGRQSLTVRTTGYTLSEETFELGPQLRDRHIRVELVPAEALTVRVVNSYGAPLVGVTITDQSGAPNAHWSTDAEGRAMVPIRRGESKTLFVLPREGSFAISTVAMPEKGDAPAEQQIVVPRGDVTIDVRTQDGSGQVVPDVALLLRHEGVVIPERVAQLMFQLHGNMLQTGKSGSTQLRNLPVGSYELWPHFSLQEFLELNRGPFKPGTSLIATPGSNAVVLTFAKRKNQLRREEWTLASSPR